MGYECPVCATPQADRRHLANHLAVTAVTHGDDHAAWLDDRVPDWSERGPEELGAVVAEHATETEYDQVFEDTVGAGHAHGQDRTLEDAVADATRGRGRERTPVEGGLTDEQRSVVDEARAMTREMFGDDGTADGEQRDRSRNEHDDGDDETVADDGTDRDQRTEG